MFTCPRCLTWAQADLRYFFWDVQHWPIQPAACYCYCPVCAVHMWLRAQRNIPTKGYTTKG